MKILSRILLLVAVSIFVLGCEDDGIRWRQKLTLAVATPDGVKSGSAVTEVSVTLEETASGSFDPVYRLRGEATVVDLGGGKYLFAVLNDKRPNRTAEFVETAFGTGAWITTAKSELALAKERYTQLSKRQGRQVLEKHYYPLLLTFTRPGDPTSLKEVNPKDMFNAFGSRGFKVQSITLEVTDEAATQGLIEGVQPWLASSQTDFSKLPQSTGRLAGISKASFIRE